MFLVHMRRADIELVQKVADVLDHKSNCLAVFDLEWLHVAGKLAGVVALGSLGICSIGTLFAAIAVRTRFREVMLPLLLLPLLIPILASCVQATGDLLSRGSVPFGPIQLLLVADAIYLIVAGALQDHRRAIVMGTKSFGKGSVQTIIPLSGHGAMRLTTARYYTPSGGSIQAKGIEPDIVVEQARIEALDSGPRRSEADLRGALDNRGGTDDTGADQAEDATAETDDNDTPQDFQLARALDLLQGLALFNQRAVN